MATATFESRNNAAAASQGGAIRSGLASWFTAFGKAITVSREYNQRRARIANLNALSDRDLADIGLSRDQIIHYVYSDFLKD
ncbi:DUF1127 domain-containing protein [Oceaniglobus trochenteri]|uniref:DUF1127 domain-containing protein n=1 Tax=Oceaniglobus trochenteri TaxID=2763260 RepID=UPI001CFF54DC|nr:DUF1127 domain-containing protein [Oceaniglobus trochenteri]